MSIVYFPERKAYIEVPAKGTWMNFYLNDTDSEEWKFFENISKQLRDLDFAVMMYSAKDAFLPKISYAGDDIIGKKEIEDFVKLLKGLHQKNLLEKGGKNENTGKVET